MILFFSINPEQFFLLLYVFLYCISKHYRREMGCADSEIDTLYFYKSFRCSTRSFYLVL